MQRYALVSGLFLALLTCVQLLRLILRWQVTVAGVDIPLWASVVAVLIAGSLAIWAFRVRGNQSSSAAV
jgi:hypothetical protein